jgi:hypothetical protein
MRIISSIRSPLFALVLLAMSTAAYAQIGISISFAPPELPRYEQPLVPAMVISGPLGTGLTPTMTTTGYLVHG